MAPPRTLLTLEDLEPLLAQYPLRARALTPVNAGTINSNYRLDTAEGPLFLRVNEGKREKDARFEAELIWHLGSRGVRTPQLWRTRRGEPYVLLPGQGGAPPKPVMIMGWVPGVEIPEEEIGPEAAREIGAALGRLHRAAASFPQGREGIYTLAHIAARIRRLHAEPRVPDGIVEFLGREAERLAGARDGSLPRGVGHSDLFPDNVLFAGRRRPELLCILDLEQAATIPYVYDIAVSLLSFCAAPRRAEAPEEPRLGPLRLAPARALVEGYEALRPLSEAERAGLYEELRYAALRFTTTRLTDVHLRARPAGEGAPAPAAHSKDYRDFLRRLEALQEAGAGAVTGALFGGRA